MNDKSFLIEIDQVLQSVEIISSTSLEFLDNSYSTKGNLLEDGSSFHKADRPIVLLLRDLLYRVFHCRQPYSSEWNTLSVTPSTDSRDLLEALSAANMGAGTWEPDWEIKNLERGGSLLAIHKNGLTLWVPSTQFLSVDGINAIGKKGSVKMTKEYRKLLPGFYMAVGNIPAENNDSIIVRLYWNIKPSHAPLLMRFITTDLNGMSIPFHLKILGNPNLYPRADAGVLYIKKPYLPEAAEILLKIYHQVRSYLYPSTPLFAKMLYPGMSLAEDPIPNDRNESFGQNRSRILAESIHSAYKKKLTTKNKKILEIRSHFRKLNLDIERPYLNPLSSDDYDDLFSGRH